MWQPLYNIKHKLPFLELEQLRFHAGWVIHKISDSWASLYSSVSEVQFPLDNQGRAAYYSTEKTKLLCSVFSFTADECVI